ncbi:hypothetical protein B0H16DRAFT_1517213 [Mycena metata]|uniref:Uncharacterized protein n=1 Tax=Mycena metata TaxID=1033252 RepID=A0AAD7JR10_9AGAR|nr:hypothetical protein B0H16DRAFT_1517213 [Mycena metata]
MSQITTQSQSQGDEEDDPSSPEYIILIRDVVRYIRQERQNLVSALDEHDLQLFEAFSEDAQKLLVCLSLIRKDLKWHPIRRLLKLGVRLDLDQAKLEGTMSELCKALTPHVRTEPAAVRIFARDESQMSFDERLSCLTVEQLRKIGGAKEPTKAELMASFKLRNSPMEFQSVRTTLGKCIQIQEHVTRLFRRLILLYYSGVCPLAEGYVRPEGSAPMKIVEGIGRRLGLSRMEVSQVDYIDDSAVLVRSEHILFPNPKPPKKTSANDNYLPIFDDVLLAIIQHASRNPTAVVVNNPTTVVVNTVMSLSDAARHVLAGVLLGASEIRHLACGGLFDPVKDTAQVIAELCSAPLNAQGGALCQDEHQEEFDKVLERLTFKQLVDLGKGHGIKGSKKSIVIGRIIEALPQKRINSTQTLHEIFMPKVLEMLNGSRNRKIFLHPDFAETMNSCVKEYFRRHPYAPSHIAEGPFNTIRQRFPSP